MTIQTPPNAPIAAFGVNQIELRGNDLISLIESKTSFASVIALLCDLGPITPMHTVIINALLVAWADHGEAPPSTQAARFAASCDVPLLNSVLAGLLCFGERHAPVEAAARFLVGFDKEQADIEGGEIIPGFGHPVHTEDPRVEAVLEIAREFPATKYRDLLRVIDHQLPIGIHANLAGVTAALWLDMGGVVETAALISIIGRSVGLAAHSAEERAKGKFKPPV